MTISGHLLCNIWTPESAHQAEKDRNSLNYKVKSIETRQVGGGGGGGNQEFLPQSCHCKDYP